LVTKVAIRALGTVHAQDKTKKRTLPMILFVARRGLGMFRFFQRMSAGRGAR
jgi:hypothetical protein